MEYIITVVEALEKVAAILLPHATIAGELQLHSHTAKGFETKTYPLDSMPTLIPTSPFYCHR